MELCYWKPWETNSVVITAYLNARERSEQLFFLFIFKKNKLFPETKIIGGLLWKALLEAPHETCLGKPLFLSLHKITQNLQENHSQNMASIVQHHRIWSLWKSIIKVILWFTSSSTGYNYWIYTPLYVRHFACGWGYNSKQDPVPAPQELPV